MLRVAPRFETKSPEKIFRHRIFKRLLNKGKITEDVVTMVMKWRHSGFNVFCGDRIQPGNEKATSQSNRPPKVREYSIDYSMSQLLCFPDLLSGEAGSESDNLSRASRSNEWLYVDPGYPEIYPP